MSTEKKHMNFRRVLHALRERQELEQLLEARPGESLVDAAKRLRASKSVSTPNPKPPVIAEETIATIQVVGDNSEHVAEILARLAERIRADGAFAYDNSDTYDENGHTHAYVKPCAGLGEGECAIDAGEFWGVGYAESFPGEEIAFFANKDTAIRFSQGKPLFDEDEGLQPPNDGDLCVVRALLVGSIWNSTEPPPEDKKP